MATTKYPLRSVLYVPGNNTRALNKVSSLAADALILDLEDGVGPAGKGEARDSIKNFLKSRPQAKYVTVRVNALESEWVTDDLNAFLENPPDAIVFPKFESAEEVKAANNLLTKAGYGQDTRLWGMIETPLGVLNSGLTGAAGGRLECLVVGTSDLVKDLHAKHTMTREPILFSLSLVVLVARANGLAVIDGVHLDINDEQGLKLSCRQGADMGFDGKTVIHPSQIAAANEAFSPSSKDIAEAEKITAAFEAATKDGKGVVLVDGKLVEALHIENAKRILALAEIIKDKIESQ